MTDYRSTDEGYVYSSDLEALFQSTAARMKCWDDRENTFTGPAPDGKTPFLDVFRETRGEPYALRFAKGIVSSWLVSEPLLWEGEYLLGHPRPDRPLYDHFSFGLLQRPELWEHPAYKEKRDGALSYLKEHYKELYPLDKEYMFKEARRRFASEEHPNALDEAMTRKLWKIGSYQGHTVPSYPLLLEKGIDGTLREIRERLTEETEPRKRETLQAMETVVEGFSRWILLQAEHAEKRAEAEPIPRFAARYRRAAKNARRIARHLPETYGEALQLVWFYHLWDCVDCLGRADQYLYPFFARAVKEDRAEAEALTAAFVMKIMEHGAHNVTLGGLTPEGADGTNELSFLLLQLVRRNHSTHPRVSIRLHKDSDPALLSLAVKMWSEGMCDPSLASDSLIVKGFEESLGVPAADARDYSVLGCQELEIPGKSNFGCEDGLINLAKILEITLHGGRTADGIPLGPNTGDWTEFEDFEALWQAFETQLCFFTRHFAELTNMGQTVRAANYAKLIKAPFTSDCIARGKTSDEGGALYNFGCVETMGAACTADSLTAIKRLCFEEKRLDKKRLMAALDADFEGFEAERLMLRTKAPKYGNDNEEADTMARRVLLCFWEELRKYRSVRGGVFCGACSLLLAGVHYGKGTAATPDGRRAGEPLGNSVGPVPGRDKKGLTAMLLSCGKMPLELALGGTTCNLTLPRSAMKTKSLRRKIEQVMLRYVHGGGQLAQVTSADLEELKEAKLRPEKYPGLFVRVGGYSVPFCELLPEEQDEVIARYCEN